MGINRDLSSLDDDTRKKVKGAMLEIEKTYLNAIFIVEAGRTIERQRILFAEHKSKTLKSKHIEGRAVDIAFNGKELYPKDLKRWQDIAKIFKKHGMNWGYNLWKWDKPHFQNNDIPYHLEVKPKGNMVNLMEKEVPKESRVFTGYDGADSEIKALIEIGLERKMNKRKRNFLPWLKNLLRKSKK